MYPIVAYFGLLGRFVPALIQLFAKLHRGSRAPRRCCSATRAVETITAHFTRAELAAGRRYGSPEGASGASTDAQISRSKLLLVLVHGRFAASLMASVLPRGVLCSLTRVPAFHLALAHRTDPKSALTPYATHAQIRGHGKLEGHLMLS